jgi:hypothetical protein
VLSRNKKAASEEAAQDDPYSVVVFKLPRSGLVQGIKVYAVRSEASHRINWS